MMITAIRRCKHLDRTAPKGPLATYEGGGQSGGCRICDENIKTGEEEGRGLAPQVSVNGGMFWSEGGYFSYGKGQKPKQ